MNRTATKLLYRYAAISESDIRVLKKWWNTLSSHQKAAERERMEAELGMEKTADAEEVTPETES